MSTPEPELPWYQFSLRSLLLFVAFVAVVCSLGVCTNWPVSLAVLIGLPLGIMVIRAREKVVVCGFQFFLIALVGCRVSSAATGGLWETEWWWTIGWWLTIVIAVVMGGVYGHLMADASKARRRWLQIIPLALLSLMLLEGVDPILHKLRQQKTIEAITKLGGSMESYPPYYFGECVSIKRTEFSDAEMERLKDVLKAVPGLKELRLDQTQITDAGLEQLKGLTRLECLSLTDTKVTAAGVEKLKQALPTCTIYR